MSVYTAIRTQRQNQRTLDAATESRTTEAFTKAVDHLGSVQIATRVGGVQGLYRVLEYATSERDYWSVLDTLSGFVRENASRTKRDGEARDPRSSPPSDLQAALDVLLRRTRVIERPRNVAVDLRGTDLRGAWLRGGNLRDTYWGDALLDAADLQAANVDYAEFDDTSMKGANLQDVSFEQSRFFGPVYIDGADMHNARVRKDDWSAHFVGEPTRGRRPTLI